MNERLCALLLGSDLDGVVGEVAGNLTELSDGGAQRQLEHLPIVESDRALEHAFNFSHH